VTAKTTSQRPSQLLGIEAEWTAYQFDSAVSLLGNVLEGASQEMEEVGTGKDRHMQRKYTMQQLLDPEFRLPREHGRSEEDPVAALKRMRGQGVKVFKVDE